MNADHISDSSAVDREREESLLTAHALGQPPGPQGIGDLSRLGDMRTVGCGRRLAEPTGDGGGLRGVELAEGVSREQRLLALAVAGRRVRNVVGIHRGPRDGINVRARVLG